jgi:hypothetical protein
MWIQSRFVLVAIAALAVSAGPADGKPRGRDGGGGCRPGMGRHGEPGHDDHAGFHYLLEHRDRIRRTVTARPDGVETITESDDPSVADAIRTHVGAMRARLEERRPIHARDPLFAAVFQHADAIDMRIEDTPHGVRVTEISADPWVAKLILAHAEVVSRFLANGFAEMHRDHAVPPRR